MTEAACGFEVRELRGRPTLCVTGELDLAGADGFYRAIDELVGVEATAARSSGAAAVAVELVGCDFIDSTAIGILARLANAGIALEVFGAAGVVRRVLEVSGIGQHPRIHLRDG